MTCLSKSDFTNFTSGYFFCKLLKCWSSSSIQANCNNLLAILSYLHHSTSFCNSFRQGLFYEYIFACFYSIYGLQCMPMIGRCNTHSVDIFIIKHLSIISVLCHSFRKLLSHFWNWPTSISQIFDIPRVHCSVVSSSIRLINIAQTCNLTIGLTHE